MPAQLPTFVTPVAFVLNSFPVKIHRLVGAIGLLLIAGLLFWRFSTSGGLIDCVNAREQVSVRGQSLTGVLPDGSSAVILHSFYNCHPVIRGDLVAYQYGGDPEPVVKIVFGLSGDKISLRPVASGTWHLIMNDLVSETPAGIPYLINEEGYRVLSLYVSDYKGVIPSGALLLLGSLPDGSFDSRNFGLVSTSDLLGKVVRRY